MSSRRRRRRVRNGDDENDADFDQTELQLRRERYKEAIYREGCECCCSKCCECCNYRCWGIFILVLALISTCILIVFGAWAIDAWIYGMAFGLAILIVSVISLFLLSIALYGVVHGLIKYIFVGVVFAALKVLGDIIYGLVLGFMVDAHYMVGAVYQTSIDAFILWVLLRCYQIAKSVDNPHAQPL